MHLLRERGNSLSKEIYTNEEFKNARIMLIGMFLILRDIFSEQNTTIELLKKNAFLALLVNI